MITYGYAKDHYYSGDGTLQIQVRIPNIHGPYKIADANGQTIRNYVSDKDLPYYQSLLLPHLPTEGEIVALQSINDSNNEFIVLGLTGASYASTQTK